jgi:hypothetical protein
VNDQQVREMPAIFTTDLHRFRSSVRSRAPSGPVGSSRHRSRAEKPPGDKYIDTLLTDAHRKERIARIEQPSRSFPR